ncbi:peptide deformylase [Lentisphaera araneosa HTCC2155]|uniref:Peptide deformylase n=1 Tax=Lentisphaera araneosa HTCC2155 TaxID=313628 RepID=A6DUA1_9BACT|nr:peptide deformylase [Lentisphaera araneosa]EDM24789.1 peptide deformylase [Lentisphaera araneosa HTCC2155]
MSSGSHILDVKKFGNPVLRKVAEPISEINDEIRELVEEMVDTMYEENGIGLAAPQVGRSLRVFVIDTHFEDETYGSDGEKLLCPKMPLALINPEIISTSGEDISFEEGCLSIPQINAAVVRPSNIVLKAQTLEGEIIEADFGGLTSRCMQHEIDHLDGVLFTDKAEKDDLKLVAKKLEQLRMKTEKALKKRKAKKRR